MLINEITNNYEPSYSHWLQDPNVAYVFKTGRGSTYAYYNKGPHAGGTRRLSRGQVSRRVVEAGRAAARFAALR